MMFKCVMASLLAIHVSGNRLLLQQLNGACQLNQCINTGDGWSSKRFCNAYGSGGTNYYFNQACSGVPSEIDEFVDPCCSQTTTHAPHTTNSPQYTILSDQSDSSMCCDCMDALPIGGCIIDPQCSTQICEFDTFCCADHWDKTCVFYATEQCKKTNPKTTIPAKCQLNECINTGTNGEYSKRYCNVYGGGGTNYYFNQACNGTSSYQTGPFPDPCCTQTTTQSQQYTHVECQLNQCINTGINGKYSKQFCNLDGSGGIDYYSNQACNGNPSYGFWQSVDPCCTQTNNQKFGQGTILTFH